MRTIGFSYFSLVCREWELEVAAEALLATVNQAQSALVKQDRLRKE